MRYPDLDIDLLRCFATVAEQGGFTSAGLALGLRLLGGAPCFMPRHWQTTAGVFSGVSLRCIRVSGIRVSGQSGNVGRPDRTVTNSESDGFSVPSRRARHPGTMAPLRHSARRDLARARARVLHASLRRVMPPRPCAGRAAGDRSWRTPPAARPPARTPSHDFGSRLATPTPDAAAESPGIARLGDSGPDSRGLPRALRVGFGRHRRHRFRQHCAPLRTRSWMSRTRLGKGL